MLTSILLMTENNILWRIPIGPFGFRPYQLQVQSCGLDRQVEFIQILLDIRSLDGSEIHRSSTFGNGDLFFRINNCLGQLSRT